MSTHARAAAPAAPHTPAPASVTLSILAINDVHGRLSPLPFFGGYVDNLRAARERDGGAVLLLDAGDIFQGTLESNESEGAAMVRAYAALGVAATTVGNHELDFGPLGPAAVARGPGDDPLGALRARAQQAPFPFLATNLRSKHGGPLPIAAIKPAVVLDVAGVRVGIVGGLTASALEQTHAGNVKTLALDALAPSVEKHAQALRDAGARVVIALMHAGGECSDVSRPDDLTSCDHGSELFALAHALAKHPSKVDMIIGGHTHAGMAHRVAGIPVIQSYSNARAFGRVDLTVSLRDGRVQQSRIFPPTPICDSDSACAAVRYEGAPVRASASVLAVVSEELARGQQLRMQPLGVRVTRAVRRDSKRESALSNLVADLMRRAAPNAEVALNNGGAVRTSLPAGDLTYGHLYEMYPFDSTLVTLQLSAADLARVVANSLRSEHGLLAISGVTARARCERGALHVDILRDGQLLPPFTLLQVATSDFVAEHGDALLAGLDLSQAKLSQAGGKLIRDILIEGLSQLPNHVLDGEDPALLDPAHPRLSYPSERPVRCK